MVSATPFEHIDKFSNVLIQKVFVVTYPKEPREVSERFIKNLKNGHIKKALQYTGIPDDPGTFAPERLKGFGEAIVDIKARAVKKEGEYILVQFLGKDSLIVFVKLKKEEEKWKVVDLHF
ncbi:hypothetical protein [Carboxydothermus islandicus]|uniref:hypothetical protein n=1 Tax=Carboxydothermus islandicus TaxID=661089 RepID=UPI001177F306|nr:hypothetical protein [Carboxydothermus islandicus]